MEEKIKFKDFEPKFPKPTKEEIENIVKEFKSKFNNELSKTDAAIYLKLRNELGFWMKFEKQYEQNGISKNMANQTKDLLEKKHHKDITVKQAYLEAEKVLVAAIAMARIQIDNDIKTIIDKYK